MSSPLNSLVWQWWYFPVWWGQELWLAHSFAGCPDWLRNRWHHHSFWLIHYLKHIREIDKSINWESILLSLSELQHGEWCVLSIGVCLCLDWYTVCVLLWLCRCRKQQGWQTRPLAMWGQWKPSPWRSERCSEWQSIIVQIRQYYQTCLIIKSQLSFKAFLISPLIRGIVWKNVTICLCFAGYMPGKWTNHARWMNL